MIEGEYQDPGSSPGHPPGMDSSPMPAQRGGTGRKRGRPKGSGRGRATIKGSSPSQSPSPSPVNNDKTNLNVVFLSCLVLCSHIQLCSRMNYCNLDRTLYYNLMFIT